MGFPTAKDISSVVGVTPATAREWLSGRRPMSVMVLIALYRDDPSLNVMAFLKMLDDRYKSPVDLRTQKSAKRKTGGAGPRRRSVREKRFK